MRIAVPLRPGGGFEAKTQSLAGTLRLAAADPVQLAGELELELGTIDTGITLRNQHLRENYLEVASRASTRRCSPRSARRGAGRHLRGRSSVRRNAEAPRRDPRDRRQRRAQARSRRGVRVAATFPLVLTDFGVEPPQYMGVGVGNRLIVQGDVPCRAGRAPRVSGPPRGLALVSVLWPPRCRSRPSRSSSRASTRSARTATTRRPAAACSRLTGGRSRARSCRPWGKSPGTTPKNREHEFLFGALGKTRGAGEPRHRPAAVAPGVRLVEAISEGRDLLMNADVTAAFRTAAGPSTASSGASRAATTRASRRSSTGSATRAEKGFGVRAGRFLPAYGVQFAGPHERSRAPRSASTTRTRSTRSRAATETTAS